MDPRYAPRALFAASFAALLPSCSEPAPPSGPNVLFITVDSLRADHLGCYGYERETSPRLDALAAESVLFERAYTHAPFTPPSHASLLTSLHVPSHGVLAWEESLDPDARTLADYFGAAGWRTGAFYNHPGLVRSEITRSFDEVQLRYFEPAEATTEALLDWIEGDRRPFAAWLHLWDVHRPYGWRDWSPDYVRDRVQRESLTLAFEEERFGTGAHRHVGRAESYYNLNRADRERPRQIGGEVRTLDDDDYRFIVDRYDGGIVYADQRLGELFDQLQEWGVMDDTIVVVTADHGESLTERDACFFTHDPFLYEDTLHVPLILRLPGARHAGLRVSSLARGIDVLPTLMELAGLPLDGRLQGVSLMGALEERTAPAVWHFAETRTRSAKESDRKASAPGTPDEWLENRLAVTDGRRKLIADRGAGSVAFFDLEDDPGETNDLADDPARRVEIEHYLGRIDEWRLHTPRARGVVGEGLSDSMRELLENLGYE